MNTHHDITVRLLDGKSLLGNWTLDFEKLPTIGDSLPLDAVVASELRGYRDHALVSRIDVDLASQDPVIILDALPLNHEAIRNVVILNENYISKPLRHDVERLLRSRLEVPVFEWVASHEARPIVDIHGPDSGCHTAVLRLGEEIRALLAAASPLTTVG
ncbi:MAG: hypothetical protein V4640_04245 [Verrucomicrobiota bacterium]